MPDNLSIDPGTTPSSTIATDLASGARYQLIKLVDSTAESTTPIGTSSNPSR